MTALLDALSARRGVVCLTGAGGKKSAMYSVAAQHPGRVALSSTAHMYEYDTRVVERVVEVARDGLDCAPGVRVVAYSGPTDTPRRVGGLSEAELEQLWLAGQFDLLLIKADGARGRSIKAPAPYEPLVPPSATTVVPAPPAR